MRKEHKETCILYFTTGNTSSKSFSLKQNQNVVIQKTLFKKTLAEIRQSGIAHVISDGKGSGETFESKIRSAINFVFEKGFQNIIVVGDDTPQLSTKKIILAANALKQNQISIGPSQDGGSYLIAFNQIHYKKDLLCNLGWQTANFHQSLISQIKLLDFQYNILSKLSDIDQAQDLLEFLKKYSFEKIGKILKSLLFPFFPSFFKSLIIKNTTLTHRDRGPPQLIFTF